MTALPQQQQAQGILPQQPAAPTGQAELAAQGPDPAQMVQQTAEALAQAIGPAQAGQLFMQIGQQMAQAGQGQQPQPSPQPVAGPRG